MGTLIPLGVMGLCPSPQRQGKSIKNVKMTQQAILLFVKQAELRRFPRSAMSSSNIVKILEARNKLATTSKDSTKRKSMRHKSHCHVLASTHAPHSALPLVSENFAKYF